MEHTQGKIINIGNLLPYSGNKPVKQQDHYRLVALWNAADGMTNEEAERYLEHGKEMNRLLIQKCFACRFHDKEPHAPPPNCSALCDIKNLFNKMADK